VTGRDPPLVNLGALKSWICDNDWRNIHVFKG